MSSAERIRFDWVRGGVGPEEDEEGRGDANVEVLVELDGVPVR